MASKRKQSEGIALLSMYNDDEDDEEMEDLEEEKQEDGGNIETNDLAEDSRVNGGDAVVTGDKSSTPRQHQVPVTSPKQQQQQVPASGSRRSRGGRFNIVDYGHDEVAMSPEPEEGEIEQDANAGDIQERTPVGTQSLDQLEHDTVMETEAAVVRDTVGIAEEVHLLDKFLPPPPQTKCSEELQRKIDKFLGLKRNGKSFNAEVRNRKDYRNPDFLLHAVTYQDIDQIGSCFNKDVFDPYGYGKSDFYDEIEADMRRERERKDQENKKNQKVEFVSGGNQPGLVAAAPKPNIPIPVAGGGLNSMPTAGDAAREGRQNKKSKWDKVDGDRRNPLPSSGQDSLSALGAHAAILSAANAGAGYMAFAQQRRREAEERRSSERKLDRRS